MLFNEFRKSNLEDFAKLLTVLEGYPADMPIKGGFTPVRVTLIVITCPRPPVALLVGQHHYRGEFEIQNKQDNYNLVGMEDAM